MMFLKMILLPMTASKQMLATSTLVGVQCFHICTHNRDLGLILDKLVQDIFGKGDSFVPSPNRLSSSSMA